jgi:hypothetical protein
MFYVFSVLLPVRFFANAYADPEPGKEMLNLSFRFRCATVFAGFRCCDDCVAVYFGSVDCKREKKIFGSANVCCLCFMAFVQAQLLQTRMRTENRLLNKQIFLIIFFNFRDCFVYYLLL